MHYAYITCIKRLCGSQHSKSHAGKYFCDNCLQFYTTTNTTHNKLECGKVASYYPEPNTTTSFNGYHKKLSPPVVIYADIEAVLENYEICLNNPATSATTKVQKHSACAVSFYIAHKYDPTLNELWTYEGEDCIKQFCKTLKERTLSLFYKYWATAKSPSTDPIDDFDQEGSCCACEKVINDGDLDKHFDQFSGKYVGPIHKNCKPKYKLSDPFFPVVFHNLSKYDIHLFITELEGDLNPIPCNKELYIALTQTIKLNALNRYKIRYIDSVRFLNSSLEKLSSYMEDRDFKILATKFQGEKFRQMRRKGVFPYDYLDSFEKFNETQLPSIDSFYNSLSDENCSVEDYSFAQKVWDTFNCNTIRDYLKLYLESDVLILADVFENFRNICRRIYKLDPINYVTAPSISWDAMLKFTNVHLELISDGDMYNFLKRAVRGGLTQCSQRISIANNKYLNNFDPSKRNNFLSYIDANNLYGWAMSQPLPLSGFKFLTREEIALFDYKNILSDGDVGYMLEVDLEYPPNQHDSHNYLPFCPENKVPPGGKQAKLIADLTNKSGYIIHLKQLQLCLQHGLILRKIHRILSFTQSCWLKPYIDLNTNQRKLARNDFEKNFYKLMNNAVYGKTMENVEKRRKVVLVKHYESRQNSPGFRQRIARNDFHSVELFGTDLAAIESTPSQIMYDKPIYIGVAVLELSKWLMYEFYYNFLLVKSPSTKIIYMDTDSFILSSEDDFYETIKANPDRFDTSNYKLENKYQIIQANNREPGKMKDEHAGDVMTSFAGLKAKAYSCVVAKDKNKTESIQKIKGVKKSVIKKLSHTDYIECIKYKKTFYGAQRVIRSRSHTLYTEIMNKISLNYKDDKRYILPDNCNTLAHGHYKIEHIINSDQDNNLL
ncbi:uncharacterized protein LOC121530461 [Drosophila eugracilis]|nr:uncharacterized protein LOC121530461 [Drosophila eugracilis]